jgi:hypothetical protein
MWSHGLATRAAPNKERSRTAEAVSAEAAAGAWLGVLLGPSTMIAQQGAAAMQLNWMSAAPYRPSAPTGSRYGEHG